MRKLRFFAAFALMLCADAAAVLILLSGGSLHEVLICVLASLVFLLPSGHKKQVDKEKAS